jgi:hypothetical protein
MMGLETHSERRERQPRDEFPDDIQLDVIFVERDKNFITICHEDDIMMDGPIRLRRHKVRVISGKLQNGEIITVEMKEQTAISVGLHE